MAQNQMQGLFTGPGVNDVYARQRQERDQKVRQAMADSAGAGGNFYANLQAKANEQMSQALQGGVRGLLQGTDLAPAEDPRLAAARKREGDKTEIMAMLSGYSDDGVITPDEMRLGYSELMRRGYPNEARQFLKDAQSEDLNAANTVKANASLLKAQNAAKAGRKLKFKGPVMKTKTGSFWQSALHEDGSEHFVQLSGPKEESFNKKGAEITDTRGQTWDDRVNYVGATEDIKTEQIGIRDQYKNALAKGKDVAKAFLDRRTAELQRDNNLSLDKAKQRAGAELITEREYIKGGLEATENLPQLEKLLAIASDGNYTGGEVASAFKSLGKAFNFESGSEASFRTGTKMMLVKLLKPLMDSRPTDKDLQELKGALANPDQSTAANIDILTRFVAKMKKDKKAGKYFANSSDATLGGWFNGQDAFSQLGTAMTPPDQRRGGEMVRKDGEAYKFNKVTNKWLPQRWNGKKWVNQ